MFKKIENMQKIYLKIYNNKILCVYPLNKKLEGNARFFILRLSRMSMKKVAILIFIYSCDIVKALRNQYINFKSVFLS